MNSKYFFDLVLSILFLVLVFLVLPDINRRLKISHDLIIDFYIDPNEICNKIRYSLNNPNISCEYLCVRNIPTGQFGNHLIELLRAYHFAKYVGLKSIIFQHYFMYLDESFKYKDIQIEMASVPYRYYRNHCIPYNFYFPLPNLPRIPFEIDPEFKKWFLKKYPKISIPDDTLTIYVRSGSIFNKGYVHSLYGQPPCNYYLDVIKMRNWSDIRIIAEDDKNPCIGLIREKGGKFEQHPFEVDFSILIGSKNLVISRGSFGYAFILFSYGIKRLYTFNSPSSKLVDHMNCVPTDYYMRSVIDRWTNSDFQRQLMLNSTCEKWEFIPHGNSNLNAFLHENSL